MSTSGLMSLVWETVAPERVPEAKIVLMGVSTIGSKVEFFQCKKL